MQQDVLIATLTKKMVDYSKGNLHDVSHLLKVHAFARTLGILEKLSERELLILEIAALLHDIACPLCRAKYGGHAYGKDQEREGGPLAREFLESCALPELDAELIGRVVFLVSHHHTLENVTGRDYQLLMEADYLVNAAEHPYSTAQIGNMREKLFKSATGKALLDSLYLEKHVNL